MRHTYRALALAGALVLVVEGAEAAEPNGIVVFQSDFGLKDGAVSAMKGVALGVDQGLILEDLTHEIPAFDIWQGAYRLFQTVPYWPEGTVFVSVVDPGVGTDRQSVVAELGSGHYVVTPDNGTLTLVADSLGVVAVRSIDEDVNRLPGSASSNTFHGRDVYAYTGARLASGAISYQEVGPRSDPEELVAIPYQPPVVSGGLASGTIAILDVQFGNAWTNIDQATFETLGVTVGDVLGVRIEHAGKIVYEADVPLVATFAEVPEGEPLLYINSLGDLALALNFDDFAATYGIESGPDWTIEVAR
jgi:S-adenosylmethionine hydrolase